MSKFYQERKWYDVKFKIRMDVCTEQFFKHKLRETFRLTNGITGLDDFSFKQEKNYFLIPNGKS